VAAHGEGVHLLRLNYANLVDPLLRRLRAQVPQFAGMPAGSSVLDVCCGTGAQVLEYAACGLRAHGLDINPDMLALARRGDKREFEYEPCLYLADAACMPFKDSLFDYASITLALHDKDEVLQDGILSEMKRVVNNKGRLVLVDYTAPAPRSVMGTLVRVIEHVAGGEHARNYMSFIKRAGLDAILARHSLRIEKTQVVSSGLFRMVLCCPA
jgi:ubiquinone/menaquinone biosynthesis C-methylase UbiE